MSPSQVPEIRRSLLSLAALRLYSLGIRDPATFDWIEPPDANAINYSVKLVKWLGCVDGGKLNERGKNCLELGVDPMVATMIFKGIELGCGKVNLIFIDFKSLLAEHLSDWIGGGCDCKYVVLCRSALCVRPQ